MHGGTSTSSVQLHEQIAAVSLRGLAEHGKEYVVVHMHVRIHSLDTGAHPCAVRRVGSKAL